MPERKEWEGFKGKIWKDEINTRDFIQENYTPYDGDETFLVGPTDATDKLWGKLLGIINTPAEVIDDSLLYLNIYIFGLPFLFFYNVATGIFSAMGDSRTPFIFLAISSTSNIAMDILFVKAFNMGIAAYNGNKSSVFAPSCPV